MMMKDAKSSFQPCWGIGTPLSGPHTSCAGESIIMVARLQCVWETTRCAVVCTLTRAILLYFNLIFMIASGLD